MNKCQKFEKKCVHFPLVLYLINISLLAHQKATTRNRREIKLGQTTIPTVVRDESNAQMPLGRKRK